MLSALEQGLGALLVLLFLLDVFLTVLYARIGTGPISRHGTGIVSQGIARLTWSVLRRVAGGLGRYRKDVLSLCGPVVLVLMVAAWSLGLTLGTAMIVHPALGSSVRAEQGPTPTDFGTALYAAGSSLTITGSGSFSPHTTAFRMFYLFNSLAGVSIMSLTVTYLLQVYNALLRRDVLGLQLHMMSGDTGDAAELIAGLGPEGQFDHGYSDLSRLAVEMTNVREAYHFYPMLFYFRSRDASQAVCRFALLTLDTVALIKSGLEDERYAWLKESAALSQLWRASMALLTTLDDAFLPGHKDPAEPGAHGKWRRRYAAGLRRIRQAGIQTMPQEQTGADLYVALRIQWDRHILHLAEYGGYGPEDCDPAGNNPEETDQRQDFRTRRHAAE